MEKRKLGFWETGATLLHDQAAGTGILFALANIKGKVDPALVREALYLMHQKYPLLRATIQKDGNRPSFELNAPFEEIPFEQIHRKGEKYWEEIAERNMRILFPTNRHLWRSILLVDDGEQAELLFFFHHAIMDGQACIRFIDELLRRYVELEILAPFEIVPMELLPPVENFLDKHPSPHSIKETLKQIVDKPRTNFQYQKFVPIGERTTKFQIIPLESSFLKHLTTLCHRRKLNVNSLLYSALILAVQRLEGKKLDILVPTPINLRKFCASYSLDDYIGSLVSYICDHFEGIGSNTDVWSLAKTYQEKLANLIPKTAFLPTDFTVDEIGELNHYLDIKNIGQENFFRFPLTITDEGKFELPDIYGSLKLDAFYVTHSLQSGVTMINLSVTSVLGKMFFCFSYPYPLVDNEYPLKLSHTMLDLLKKEVA